MNRMILAVALAAASLSACATPQTSGGTAVAPVPGASSVCAAIKSDKFDVALKAYGAATDAVNLIIDAKVIVPGTPRAVALADANDRVLAAFGAAEQARKLCNATSYEEAMRNVSAGIDAVKLALKR